MSQPAVLLAGCGDLGTEAALRFIAAGWQAIGLRRSADRLPAGITQLSGDLTQPLDEVVADLPPLAALVYTPAADERTEAAYRSAYVDGLSNLLDSLDRVGARPDRVLAVSSTAVYGSGDLGEVDEQTPLAPGGGTAAVLVEAEQLLHARRPDGISLRLSGIYGPGRTFLIDQVRQGRAKIPDTPVLTNRIHRDDAATAIVHLLTTVTDLDPIYLGVDDAPVDRGEVVRFLAAELGLPEPPVGDVERRRGGNKSCSNARLRRTGFTLAYPTYREGYRAVLAGEGTRHP